MSDDGSRDDGLRIIELTAENFKRLRAVNIRPGDGSTVIVSGRNAQGKSSVLDAIWAALAGKDGAVQRPIRDGERKATVTLDLGEFTVTRKWTGATSTLTVTSGNAKYNSPQKVLDELIGRLSFDPLAFATMEPAKQRATLVEVAGIQEAIDELVEERKTNYDGRTESNRDVKRLRAQLDGLPPAGPHQEHVDIAELLEERQVAVRRDELRVEHKRLVEEIRHLQERQRQVVAEGQALSDSRTTKELDDLLGNAQQINRAADAATQRAELEAALSQAEGWAQAATDRIAELDEKRETLIREAALPVEGLSFDEEGVLYNGIPFAQASAAERLRVSVAMAMAMNPKVRVIRISDGSLLDRDNLALIEAMAADKGFQVWIERVGDEGDVGVVIEDGEVKA